MLNRRKSGFQYGLCEPRNLLTSISLNGGELLLGGDSNPNVASVSISGGIVSASITGSDSMTFPAANVSSIRFVGLGGDDQFTNGTSIPSFAFGQAGNDTLIGGSGIDRLVGGTGTDILTGNDGDDEIRGGADGIKEIDGGAGNDRLFGGRGMNTIRGGTGNDTVFGGPDVDIIFGGAGNDNLFTGQGNNIVEGGSGIDLIISGAGDDELFGEEGNDRIFAGEGDDEIDGGEGNDVVVGRAGNDVLLGGAGDDFIRGNDGDDRLEGGDGDDRLQGDAGDDQLIGGSNSENGFDRVLLAGIEGRYRIAGDLFARDRTGDDGTDDLESVEWINYLNPASPSAHRAVSQIEETITIQPIIVSNTNGSNTAEYFGAETEEAEIQELINDIYYQARIQADFLTPNEFNSTFANVGNGGTRPFQDAFRIFEDGAAANVTNSDALTINVFFVGVVPGSGNLPENTSNGLALDSENGVVFRVGDQLPTFQEGREVVARVAAHEIAHNLGLAHVASIANLLDPSITGTQLTQAQAGILIDSRFSR